MGTGRYCVECLIELQEYEAKDDGCCELCREHLANGGKPRTHSITEWEPKGDDE
jgi:hypothetical protein